MSEFEAGQKWIGKEFRSVVEILGYSPALMEVWFFEESSRRAFTAQVDGFVSRYEKIKPFFEVGRTYVFKGEFMGDYTYRVTDVRKLGGTSFAIAERSIDGGTPSHIVVLRAFDDFEEI